MVPGTTGILSAAAVGYIYFDDGVNMTENNNP
jgi:hypothetical protein